MSQPELLTELLQELNAPQHRYAELDRHYAGKSPLAYLAPEDAEALGNRLRKVSVNIPKLLVDSICERLRVTGFDGVDITDEWNRLDLDQLQHIAHREALVLGSSWAIAWASSDGRPTVSIESAHQMAALTDPGSRQILYAVKSWEDERNSHAVVYGPDEIVRYRSNQLGATTAGFTVVERLANPLGVVPVVRFSNTDRLLEGGCSEMSSVLDLSDAAMKLYTDMLVASEFTARPRRTAVGVDLHEVSVLDEDGNDTGETVEVNPFPESDRMLLSESPDTKFGQLPGSDLGGYQNAINVVMRAISAVSGLPEHMLGLGGDNPTSADSIRASEAALTARSENRQAQLGRSWEALARLVVAIRDGVDPMSIQGVRVQWADAATRSVAQEADSVTKLVAAGILPVSYALAKLGYSQAEIQQIRVARRAEALDTAGINLGRPA